MKKQFDFVIQVMTFRYLTSNSYPYGLRIMSPIINYGCTNLWQQIQVTAD
jgi:hypothetical protein